MGKSATIPPPRKARPIKSYRLRLTAATLVFQCAFCTCRVPWVRAAEVPPLGASRRCSGLRPPPPPSYRSFFWQQRHVVAQSAGRRIELLSWTKSRECADQFTFRVDDLSRRALSSFLLCNETEQVDEIDIINSSRVLVLGRVGANFPIANIIELPSGRLVDQFPCFDPIISPDHRFLAFIKSFPGHPGPVAVSNEYLVYDLTKGASYNRPGFKSGVTYDLGWPVYPPGATNAVGENLIPGLDSPAHLLMSTRLFWLDSETFAFSDLFSGQNRLVVVNLRLGIRSPLVRTLNLNTLGLIDLRRCQATSSPSDFERWSKDPAVLIRVGLIARITSESKTLCLHIVPHPCVTVRSVEVAVGARGMRTDGKTATARGLDNGRGHVR